VSEVQRKYYIDPVTGEITFRTTQDVEDILDRNKELAKHKQRGDFRHIASIPNVILNEWIMQDGVNYLGLPADEWGKLIKRKLRDPDWAWLRTS
jgi:hypothetical protein